MLVTDAILKIRDRISDQDAFGYQDSEILNYINDAISLLWLQLIALGSTEVIKRSTASSSTVTKPIDFYKLIGVPTLIDNGTTFTNYGKVPQDFCYFTKPATVTLSDSLPFNNNAFHTVIIQIASMYALNRSEFEIAQDKSLADEIRTLIK